MRNSFQNSWMCTQRKIKDNKMKMKAAYCTDSAAVEDWGLRTPADNEAANYQKVTHPEHQALFGPSAPIPPAAFS